MSVLHHGDHSDSPHKMELCCPGRERRIETNETYTCHTTTSMYMYSIMQACERDGSALTDTDYTSMDNSKVILCCDLIDGNDVMKSPHRLHQTLVLQTFFCDEI